MIIRKEKLPSVNLFLLLEIRLQIAAEKDGWREPEQFFLDANDGDDDAGAGENTIIVVVVVLAALMKVVTRKTVVISRVRSLMPSLLING